MSQSLSELLNSLQQNGFLEFIKQVKLTVKGLEEKIKADFQKNNRLTNLSDLEKWVRLENIIKMYHVCTAYANGNLLYEKDPYHPASLHDKKQESYGNWSTLKQLEAVRFFHPSFGELKIAYSYAVADDCNSPSSVLENLLFSHTIMECRTSVQIAYYLTLLDLLKMLFHPEKQRII